MEKFFAMLPAVSYVMEEFITGDICSYDAILNTDSKSSEDFAELLREFKIADNPREPATFSNRYFFLNQFRELKFYFDYVI